MCVHLNFQIIQQNYIFVQVCFKILWEKSFMFFFFLNNLIYYVLTLIIMMLKKILIILSKERWNLCSVFALRDCLRHAQTYARGRECRIVECRSVWFIHLLAGAMFEKVSVLLFSFLLCFIIYNQQRRYRRYARKISREDYPSSLFLSLNKK